MAAAFSFKSGNRDAQGCEGETGSSMRQVELVASGQQIGGLAGTHLCLASSAPGLGKEGRSLLDGKG